MKKRAMAKAQKVRSKKPEKFSDKDQAWFERQVAELGAALNKLPASRQEQFRQELERPPRSGGQAALNTLRKALI